MIFCVSAAQPGLLMLPNPVLTIRGAFPAFAFGQADALFLGLDISGSFQLAPKYTLETTGAYVQAKNLTDDTFLPLIPPARMSNQVVRRFAAKGIITEANITIGHTTVARQTRYHQGADFIAPPHAYTLLNAEAGATLTLNERPVWFQLAVSNLLNTRYRDYLNRFRYFADETGRTFTFRVRIPIGKPTA